MGKLQKEIIEVKKNKDGDIELLSDGKYCYHKDDIIYVIENYIYNFYVKNIIIEVVDDKIKGKYLRTKSDKNNKNNLDDLPLFINNKEHDEEFELIIKLFKLLNDKNHDISDDIYIFSKRLYNCIERIKL